MPLKHWKDLGPVIFEEEPSRLITITCGRCNYIMDEPHQVMCESCDYVKFFCSNCVMKRDCHSCSVSKFGREKNFCDKRIANIINNELKVYCINKAKGCRWLGSLSQLMEHINRKEKDRKTTQDHRCNNFHCCYEELPCIHEGCGKNLMRHNLKIHEDEACEWRPHKCKYCPMVKTYNFITSEEHLKVCKKCPVKCQNDAGCGDFKRDELQSHYKKCLKQPVDCPFKWAGCTERPHRGALQEHTCETHHLSLLAARCGELTTKCGDLTTKCGDLTTKCKELKAQNEKLKRDFQDMLQTEKETWKRDLQEASEKFHKAVHGDTPIIMPGTPIKVNSSPDKVVFFTEEYGCKMAVFYGNIPFTHKVAEMAHGKLPVRDENIEFIIYGQFKIPDRLKITITTPYNRDIVLDKTVLMDAPSQSPIETKRLTAKVERYNHIFIKHVEGMDKRTTWQCF